MGWWQQFKSDWRALAHDQPGKRFQNRYRRAKAHRDGSTWQMAIAIGRIVLGGVALLAGVLEAVFPGPAILFFFVGGALLASESLTIARMMDWSELRVRSCWRWGRQRWKRASAAVRTLCVFAAAVVAAGGAYLSYQIIVD